MILKKWGQKVVLLWTEGNFPLVISLEWTQIALIYWFIDAHLTSTFMENFNIYGGFTVNNDQRIP